MNLLWIIAKREIKALLRNRRRLFSLVMFIIAWGFISLPRLIGRLSGASGMESALFFLATLLCVYSSFVLSAQAFLGDKKDSRVGTLMCTPVSMRQYWFGKILGVVIPSFCVGIIVAAAVNFVFSIRNGISIIPSVPLLLFLFVILPLLLLTVVGFLGLLQLILGMRESRIVNIIVMIALFAGLGLSTTVIGGQGFLSWSFIAALFGAVLLCFALLSYLSRFIRIERIITSHE